MDDVKELKAALQQALTMMQQLGQRVSNLEAKANEQAGAMEKLGNVTGLEYSQDLKDWVSKAKLDALRKEPR